MNFPKKVLIIDDKKENLKYMEEILASEGIYEILKANSGKKGLEMVFSQMPDVVLLDIIMPGMNGWEVCKKIKGDEKTKDIPIIVITGKKGIDDVLKAFDLGASDYITRPFHKKELLVKLKAVLKFSSEKADLQEMSENLRKITIERVNHLSRAFMFETLGKMAAGILHDLSNILFSIKGNNQLCQMSDNIENVQRYLQAQEKAINVMESFISNIKMFIKESNFKKSYFSPKKYILDILNIFDGMIKKKNIVLKLRIQENVKIWADPVHYSQICLNLIKNSLEAMKSGGELSVNIYKQGDMVVSCFCDTGEGINEEMRTKIFDLSYSTKENGSGIGLYFIRELVRINNGKVEVKNRISKGTEFFIFLPCEKKMNDFDFIDLQKTQKETD